MTCTYRVVGIKNCGEYFVFKHNVIPAKGRKKAQIFPCFDGSNPVARFLTMEEAKSERDRLENENNTCRLG